VDPLQPARDPGAGLVEVGHRRGRQLPTHDLDELLQPAGALGHHRGQRARGHRRIQHIGQQLRGSVDRQMLAGAQIGHQGTHPGSVAGCRADMGGEGRSGRAPAGAAAPLGRVLGHAQAQRRQVEHLPGLDPDHRRVGQLRAAAAAPLGQVLHDLIGDGDLGQMGAGRAPGCLPGRRRPACSSARRSARAGLPSPSEDGGLDEFEESLPRRRSNSATCACSVAIRRACSALAARSSAITAACTATVASGSGWGEGIAASSTPNGHARLPMGRPAQLPHSPKPVNSCTPSPQRLKLVEAQPARRWACPQGTRTWIERRRPRRSETA
jgi:hypothetical protein